MATSKWDFARVWQALYLAGTCMNRNLTRFIKRSMLSHKGVVWLQLSYIFTSFLIDL